MNNRQLQPGLASSSRWPEHAVFWAFLATHCHFLIIAEKAFAMISRRQFLAASAASATVSPWGSVFARGLPIKLVVGFTPGGSADFVARLLAQDLSSSLKVPVIVENRPGAGGRIAVDVVKNARPDGQTLLVTPASMLTIYPHVYDKLSYHPVRDLAPIGTLCALPYSVNVGRMVPESVRTLQDFGVWIQANPQLASYGSPGSGTTPHFVGAMFASSFGAEFVHAPYKGGPLAVQDVMAGQIASSVNVVSDAVPFADGHKLRALAVSSAQRIPQLPNVPTFAEQGMAQMTAQEWFGLLAPQGTDPAWIERLYTLSRQSFGSARVQKALYDMAYSPFLTGPAELATLIEGDIAKWGPVVQSTGFKAEG